MYHSIKRLEQNETLLTTTTIAISFTGRGQICVVHDTKRGLHNACVSELPYVTLRTAIQTTTTLFAFAEYA